MAAGKTIDVVSPTTRNVELKVGEELTIRLRERRSAGFTVRTVKYDSESLLLDAPKGRPDYQTKIDGMKDGENLDVFRFKAKRAGSTSVELATTNFAGRKLEPEVRLTLKIVVKSMG